MNGRPEGGALLEAHGLAKSYGNGAGAARVFEAVDLSLRAGTLAAIVGPSGCGKSTLLHLLGLLERPDAGRIRLGDAVYDSLAPREASRIRATKIGFVFQFDHLLPELTLAENVAVPLRLSGIGRAEARRRALEALEPVGLADFSHRFPRELSGGERQRGAVARALVNEPVLLLADEPTGNLDPASAGQVIFLFRELARRPGRVAIVVTHDREVAAGCDSIFSLERAGLREAPPA